MKIHIYTLNKNKKTGEKLSRARSLLPTTHLMAARAASRNFPLFTATSNAIRWVSINAPACALSSATSRDASANGSFSRRVSPNGSSSTGVAAAVALPLRLLCPPFFSFSSAASSVLEAPPFALALARAA